MDDATRLALTVELKQFYKCMSMAGLSNAAIAFHLGVTERCVLDTLDKDEKEPSVYLLSRFAKFRQDCPFYDMLISPKWDERRASTVLLERPSMTWTIVKSDRVHEIWVSVERAYMRNDLQTAYEFSKSLIKEPATLNLLPVPFLKGFFFNRLSVICHALGKLDEAQGYLKQAEEQLSIEDEPIWSIVQDNKAGIHLALNRPLQAFLILTDLSARNRLSVESAYNAICCIGELIAQEVDCESTLLSVENRNSWIQTYKSLRDNSPERQLWLEREKVDSQMNWYTKLALVGSEY